MVLAGMWWTVSPWRLRDLLNWSTANDRRTRLTSAIRLGFGILLIVLGVAVYRPAEQKSAAPNSSASVRMRRTLCWRGAWQREPFALARTAAAAVRSKLPLLFASGSSGLA
jgi:hypothetical protein